MPLRVLRFYHAGRDPAHRARDRALVAAGVDVTLVVPRRWPEAAEEPLAEEPFSVVEIEVARPGDVNRHRHRDVRQLAETLAWVEPDVLDVHEEPFSVVARTLLRAASKRLPVVMYTAQNVDKRLPPPFHQWEQAAYRRVAALYPCSRQAASVARGKGFAGRLEVLPLGYDEALFRAGAQSLEDDELLLLVAGRLIPEKGVLDAVRVLAHLSRKRAARLVLCGDGPAAEAARVLAVSLGVARRLEHLGSVRGEDLAGLYRAAHVVLVASRPTATWTEQFGRVIVEAQASGAVVAGYDTGSIREVAGEAALLVQTGDVHALADLVLALAADHEGFARRRRAGIELSAGRTWKRVAERQAALYGDVLATPGVRGAKPASPRGRRSAARAEFGPTAATTAGRRPFALPLLRLGGPLPYVLGALCDWLGEAVSLTRVGARPR